jgi:hypothetical protein
MTVTDTVNQPDGHGTQPLGLYQVLSGLDLDVRILARDLRIWAGRNDSEAQPEATEASNRSMAAIDRMLADLHRLRGQLVSERRVREDIAATRVGALLAEGRRDGAR